MTDKPFYAVNLVNYCLDRGWTVSPAIVFDDKSKTIRPYNKEEYSMQYSRLEKRLEQSNFNLEKYKRVAEDASRAADVARAQQDDARKELADLKKSSSDMLNSKELEIMVLTEELMEAKAKIARQGDSIKHYQHKADNLYRRPSVRDD